MDYLLPNVPTNLAAKNTAEAITKRNIEYATQLYNKCLAEIEKQKFPCHVIISDNEPQGLLSAIFIKLESAGYKVKISITKEIAYGQWDAPYEIEKPCIMIENPFVK